MSFPPSFTDVWDITQPPDTELANMLGQNLRDLKNDIMQRMSLLSGTLANRPVPEPNSGTANWGGIGYGVIYISTDSGQIFQWNGAAWIDITTAVGSGIKDYDDYTSVNFGGIAPGIIRTINLPAGAVQNAALVGSIIEIESTFRITAFTGGSPGYRLTFNGVNVQQVSSSSFAIFGADAICKTTVVLSSGVNPRSCSRLEVNSNVVPLSVLVVPFGAPITGAAPVAVVESFIGSTTINATGHYMHIRVRK